MAEVEFTLDPTEVPPIEVDPPAPVGASGPPLAKNVDHCPQALNARTQDYVGLPRFEELLRIYCEQAQEVEDAVWQIAEDSVSTAVGVQLDGFGSIVGADREGLSDDDYRALIRATIVANRSEGTAPDLFSIIVAALALDAPGLARLEFYPPAAYVVEILNPPAFDAEILHGLLQRGTAAGVRGITIVSDEPVGTRLRLSRAGDFPAFAAVTGLDSAATPGTGTGSLTRALDERTA